MSSKPPYVSQWRWRWWKLRTFGSPVRIIYYPPATSTEHHVLDMNTPDAWACGTLQWQVCHTCRRGIICKISIADVYQRRGYGRRMILRALQTGPGYTWVTSGQSEQAKMFFPAMSMETGAAFTEGGGACSHIQGSSSTLSLKTPPPRLERT